MSVRSSKRLSSKRKKLPKDNAQAEVLHKLGLEAYWTTPLDPASILDICTWTLEKQAPLETKDLPYAFLHRLWLLSPDARSPCCKSQHEVLKNGNKSPDELINGSEEGSQCTINPLDLITAVFTSANTFFQQEMTMRMLQCQFAVPLVLPNIDPEEPSCFLLWPLRGAVSQWRSHFPDRKVLEGDLATTYMPMVSCVKLGHSGVSKSQVLNNLISGLRSPCDTFLHRGMAGGQLPRRLSNGLIEIGWYLPSGHTARDIFPIPVVISNLRGDASTQEKNLSLLCKASSALVVFCGNLREKDKLLLASCKHMANKLILIDLADAEKNENRVVGFVGQDLTFSGGSVLQGRDLSEGELANRLCDTLKDLLQEQLKLVTLEAAAKLAEELGLNVDEGVVCRKAMATVEKILEDLGEGPAQFKEKQFPLQGHWRNKLAEIEKEEMKQWKEGKGTNPQLQKRKKETLVELMKYKMTPAMKLFTDALLLSDKVERTYFLNWMKLRLRLRQIEKQSGPRVLFTYLQSKKTEHHGLQNGGNGANDYLGDSDSFCTDTTTEEENIEELPVNTKLNVSEQQFEIKELDNIMQISTDQIIEVKSQQEEHLESAHDPVIQQHIYVVSIEKGIQAEEQFSDPIFENQTRQLEFGENGTSSCWKPEDEPEWIQLDEPELIQVHEPDLPQLNEPELIQVHEPELPQLEEPKLPWQDGPELTQQDEQELPKLDELELPRPDEQEWPQLDEPELQQHNEPQWPQLAKTKRPEQDELELIKLEEPESPQLNKPEPPQPSEPELIEKDVLELPQQDEPELHQQDGPEFPQLDEPEMPQLDPELIQHNEPELPWQADLELTQHDEPEQPQIDERDLQQHDKPERPQLDGPEVIQQNGPELTQLVGKFTKLDELELPLPDEPKLTRQDEPEWPQLYEPELTKLDGLELPQQDKPELSQQVGPEMPQLDDQHLPQPDEPTLKQQDGLDLIQLGEPQSAQLDERDLQLRDEPEPPQIVGPQFTQLDESELPQLVGPEFTKLDEQELPQLNEPELIEVCELELPQQDEPELLQLDEPELLQLDETKLKQQDGPNMTQLGEPELLQLHERDLQWLDETEQTELDEPGLQWQDDRELTQLEEPESPQLGERDLQQHNEQEWPHLYGPEQQQLDGLELTQEHGPELTEEDEPELTQLVGSEFTKLDELELPLPDEAKLTWQDKTERPQLNEPELTQLDVLEVPQDEPELMQLDEPELPQQDGPEKPQLDETEWAQRHEQELTQQDEPELPRLDERDLQPLDEPEPPQLVAPEFTQLVGPRFTKLDERELPQQTEPELIQQDESELIQLDEPKLMQQVGLKLPQPNKPELIQLHVLELPQQDGLELPQLVAPELTELDEPKLTQQDRPEITQLNGPKLSWQGETLLPQLNEPELTQHDEPELPQLDGPEFTKLDELKLLQPDESKLTQDEPELPQPNEAELMQLYEQELTQQDESELPQLIGPELLQLDEPELPPPNEPELIQLDVLELPQQDEPEPPQQIGPEFTQLDELELPQPNEPELNQQDHPELAQLVGPEFTQVDEPALMQIDILELPQQDEPELPQLIDPELTQLDEPELPPPNKPELIQLDVRELPQQHEPEPPQLVGQEFTQLDELELPQPNEPELKQQDDPELAQLVGPEFTQVDEPVLTQIDILELPQQDEPELPQLIDPEFTKLDELELPLPDEAKMTWQDGPVWPQLNEPQLTHLDVLELPQDEPELMQLDDREFPQLDEPKVTQQDGPELMQLDELELTQQDKPELIQLDSPELILAQSDSSSSQHQMYLDGSFEDPVEMELSSLGLEHFLREMSLIFELTRMNSKRGNHNVLRLPSLATDLLLYGIPLELMNGDASHIPMQWLGCIFAELNRRLPYEQCRTRVLTNLGVHHGRNAEVFSSLFGVKFPEGRQRSARGLYMVILCLPNNLRKDMQCDYLLLIDVEGLCTISPENNRDTLIEDNEMATVASGLSDVLMQNISSHSGTEVETNLTVIVNALLRIKEHGSMPICQVMTQDEEINSLLQASQLRRISDMLQTVTGDTETNNADNHYAKTSCITVKGPWCNMSLSEPIDTQYSEAVLKLKQNLFEALKKSAVRSKATSLPEFLSRLCSVWDALKAESFSIGLQNTDIALDFSLFCTQFSQWEDGFLQHVESWLNGATNKILARKAKALDAVIQNPFLSELKDEARQEVKTEVIKLRSKVEDYTEKDNHLELKKFRPILMSYMDDLQKRVTEETIQNLGTVNESHCSSTQMERFETSLEKEQEFRLRSLVEKSKSAKVLLQDTELEEEFEAAWSKTLSAFDFRPSETDDITARVTNILKANLIRRGLKKHLKKLKVMGQTQTSSFQVYDEHFGYRSRLKRMFEENNRPQRLAAHALACKIIEEYKQFVEDKSSLLADFSDSYIIQLLENVEKTLKEKPLDIRSAFEVDLKVYLCNTACQDFQKLHDRFAMDSELLPCITATKGKYLAEFIYQFRKRDQCQRVAQAFISMIIKPTVLDYIHKPLGMHIAQEIQDKAQMFQSPRAFHQSLLEELIEEDCFESFLEYLLSYENFRMKKIQQAVVTHLSESTNLVTWRQHRLGEIVGKVAAAMSQMAEGTNGVLSDTKPLLEGVCLTLEKDGDLDVSRASLDGPFFSITTKWDYFVKCLMELLAAMRLDLAKELSKHTEISLLQCLPIQPQDSLSKKVRDCDQKCPLCRAPCEVEERDHKVHRARLHRPKGMLPHDPGSPPCIICPESMIEENPDLSEDTHDISASTDIHALYPDWNFSPEDSNGEIPNAYWRFVLTRFNERFAVEYEQEPAKIPEEWKRITKEEALSSLRKAYLSGHCTN